MIWQAEADHLKRSASQKAVKMLLIDIIEIIVWMQIAVIGMLFSVQPTKSTMRLSLVYGLTLISHAALFELTSFFEHKEFFFYIFGGALDFAIVIYTCRMVEVSRLASDIQDVSLVSIMFNLIGLTLSYAGMQPELYMALFVALYSWAIWILIRGEPKNDRAIEIDTRLFAFSRHARKRVLCDMSKSEKK